MFQETFNVAEIVLETKLQLQSESDEERRKALKEVAGDVPRLGLFGTMLCLHDPFEPDEDVFAELRNALRAKLLEAAAEDAEEAVEWTADVHQLVDEFRERRGDDAPVALRELAEAAIFEFYELEDHGLFMSDVTNVVNVLNAARPGEPVRELLPTMTRLSRTAAKFILGCFPGNIDLIGKINERIATREEIYESFDEFAPRLMQKRLSPIAGTMIETEKRFRLAYIVWCRSRGYPMSKGRTDQLPEYFPKRKNEPLIQRLIDNAEHRRAVLSHLEEHADEIKFFTDILDAPQREMEAPDTV